MAAGTRARRGPDVILGIRDLLSPIGGQIFFILKGLRRIPFNLKFTEARYGMSGEIRYSGTASGWSG
jgi:hypothetical protein